MVIIEYLAIGTFSIISIILIFWFLSTADSMRDDYIAFDEEGEKQIKEIKRGNYKQLFICFFLMLLMLFIASLMGW